MLKKEVFKGEVRKTLTYVLRKRIRYRTNSTKKCGKLHFHSAYVGGYIDHVLRVARNSYKLKKVYEEGGVKVDFTDEELLFITFHHDLGKLGTKDAPLYKV